MKRLLTFLGLLLLHPLGLIAFVGVIAAIVLVMLRAL